MVVLAGSPVLDEVRQAPDSVVVKESVGAATELSEQGGCLDCMGDVEERTAAVAVSNRAELEGAPGVHEQVACFRRNLEPVLFAGALDSLGWLQNPTV